MADPDAPADAPARSDRRRFCAGLLLAAALPPARAEPVVEVGAQDLEWFDAARQRPVPVRIYRPSVAPTRPLPLVVFSHGIGGSRAGYGYLGRHWAARGIASLHLQHVGSDRQLWLGNPLELLGRLHGAAQEAEAIARVRDLRFALDRALAGDAGIRIDAARIVAAGHSYGANTTLLASGARVQRAGLPSDLADERVRAAVVISAPPFYGEADLQAILGPVQVPSLHVTTTDDVIRIPGYYSGPQDRLRVFDATGGADKWLAVFGSGSHALFTGRQGDASPVLQATRELAHAFVRHVLAGDGRALAEWPRLHAPLIERFVGPGAGGPQRPLTTA